MAARVGTLHRNGAAGTRHARTRLVDALKIVLPSVILTALGFAAMRRLNLSVQPAVITFGASAAIGVVAGLTTSRALSTRSELLRHVVACATVVIGLIVLRAVTQREAGLGLPVGLNTETDWEGLGQAIVAISSAILTLGVWHHLRGMLPAPPKTFRRQHRRPGPRPDLLRVIRSSVRFPAITRLRILSLPALKFRLPGISHPRRWRGHRITLFRPELHLSAHEEHRCPYCFDVVERKDPRGIKACPICHTWHHRDCWSIAGACQVPHHQA